jgi:hypothetical protein
MKPQKPRDYHEPWLARQKPSGAKHPFPDGIPEGADLEAVERCIDAYERVAANREWQIWGSRMVEPGETMSLLSPGEIIYSDDKHIVASVFRPVVPEGGPQPGDFARRIAACVNACAGIADPVAFIEQVRQILLDYNENDDPRIASLLARCLPKEERGEQGHD